MVYGRRLLDNLDLTTIAVALALVAIGVLGIASSTLDEGGSGLWQRQIVWALLATVVASVVIFLLSWNRLWH